eukprot:scaffold66644_cov31-Phaeocystis_antarctica.AAC.1
MVGCWTKAIASKCMATKHAIMSMSLKRPHSLDGLASLKLSSRSVRGVGVVLAAKSSARARDSAKSSGTRSSEFRVAVHSGPVRSCARRPPNGGRARWRTTPWGALKQVYRWVYRRRPAVTVQQGLDGKGNRPDDVAHLVDHRELGARLAAPRRRCDRETVVPDDAADHLDVGVDVDCLDVLGEHLELIAWRARRHGCHCRCGDVAQVVSVGGGVPLRGHVVLVGLGLLTVAALGLAVGRLLVGLAVGRRLVGLRVVLDQGVVEVALDVLADAEAQWSTPL